MPNPASPLTMEEVDEVSVMSSTLVDYVNSSLEGFIFRNNAVGELGYIC